MIGLSTITRAQKLHYIMKNLLKTLTLLLVVVFSATEAFAQAKDGEATVVQGSTTTVSISTAYQNTLKYYATSINYTWTVSSSVITIQSKTKTSCTIKGNTVGTAKLNYHCSYYIDGYYRTMDFYYNITIKSNTISVTSIEMSPSTATMEIGETLQLTATPYPTNATNRSVNWTTDNYSVASVSSNGLVTARGEGKVWIWARATDGSGAGNYCVVTVNAPTKVSSIELSESEKVLNIGDEFTLSASVLPGNAANKNITWTSDNAEVANVTNGHVSAVGPGNCTIICTAADGSGVSATCAVTVNEPQKIESIELSESEINLNIGESFTLKATVAPNDAYNKNVVWASNDEEVATVENGVVTAIAPGECVITCTAADGSDMSASCAITVNEPKRYWMSVKLPNGSIAVDVTDLDEVKVQLTADDGYSIHSLTLDGIEQTISGNESYFTLPKLESNATLNAVFASDISTNVDELGYDTTPLHVSVYGNQVSISGDTKGASAYVYNTNGSLVKTTTDQCFDLNASGVYILRIGNRSFKFAI